MSSKREIEHRLYLLLYEPPCQQHINTFPLTITSSHFPSTHSQCSGAKVPLPPFLQSSLLDRLPIAMIPGAETVLRPILLRSNSPIAMRLLRLRPADPPHTLLPPIPLPLPLSETTTTETEVSETYTLAAGRTLTKTETTFSLATMLKKLALAAFSTVPLIPV